MKNRIASVLVIVATISCLIIFIGCNSTSDNEHSKSEGIITFQSGYLIKTDTCYQLYVIYDLHADTSQTYKMATNSNVLNNVTVEINGTVIPDFSSYNTEYIKIWSDVFQEDYDQNYAKGCTRDILLAAGTNETIRCASIFAVSNSTSINEDTEIKLTAHLLPVEQTTTFKYSSLIEVDSYRDIIDLLSN